MNDSTKRKEPEEAEDKKVEAEEKKPAAEAEASKPAGEPEAKRQKVASSPNDPAAIRKQVEYYLSDDNLRYDKFFHEKISADSEGWLEMRIILECNKMKIMKATKEDVLSALKGSKLEVKEGGDALRRPGNHKLPALEAKPHNFQKKNSLHAHDGGFVVAFKNVPAEIGWQKIKESLKAALPKKAQLWFVSEVNDKGVCYLALAPFENDAQFFEDTTLELGGAKLKPEVCTAELLQQALKMLPKHIREKREKESRKRQKERNKPILVGTQKFLNIGALRGRVREIINSRSDGEQLKPDGSDFKLIKALLDHHPKGPEKSKDLVGIKVAQSPQGGNSCFFMVKADGTSEDFSAKKCLDAIEINPPYVKETPPPAKKAKEDAEEKKDGKKEEEKTEEEKKEEKKEEAAAPSKMEVEEAKAAPEPPKEASTPVQQEPEGP
jgi:hypothetical protein